MLVLDDTPRPQFLFQMLDDINGHERGKIINIYKHNLNFLSGWHEKQKTSKNQKK